MSEEIFDLVGAADEPLVDGRRSTVDGPSPEEEEAPARRGPAPFVALWTLAIVATVSAFVLHLAMHGRTVALGYELGRAHAEQSRLREVKRVLEVESASYKTPERVEIVARTLLGMEPPSADRVIVLPPLDERRTSGRDARERRTDAPNDVALGGQSAGKPGAAREGPAP